jgi:hypothetical protein
MHFGVEWARCTRGWGALESHQSGVERALIALDQEFLNEIVQTPAPSPMRAGVHIEFIGGWRRNL